MSELVSILEGSTFVTSGRSGDIDASPVEPQGLFHQDTRYLSRWVLTLDGKRLAVMSTDDLQYFQAQFFLAPSTGTIYVNSPVAVMRKRSVGDGFHEDLTVWNNGAEPLELELRLEADSDFADLFEVKDALRKKGELYRRVDGRALVIGYRRERFVRETRISASAEAEVSEAGLRFRLRLEPHQSWSTCLEVVAARDLSLAKHETRFRHEAAREEPPQSAGRLDRWLAGAPTLTTSWIPLYRTYQRSLVDLAALRFYPMLMPEGALPAAGLPWFMAVFGRDSLITSYQAMPFAPELARTALKVLGLRQGTTVDDFRDEEPGKILHESRAGELTAFEERPHSPYFGSADSTPLWLVLLDEYERWSGDRELVASLEPQARAALEWIDRYGDRDGDGYVEYQTRNPETGLVNQCWKDSWDSIKFANGELAPLPRACCEIQGYVYDAKVRAARLFRQVWNDPAAAERLEREAAELRRRFNQDFWLEERGFFALALDGRKRQVDSLTSNIGHLLWSGIVEPEKAARCAEALMGPKLFSGWGVRTMAEGEGAYNPIGYHVGTVWPHDTSLIAEGLRRYGYRQEASLLAKAMLEAAVYFDGRLPEAFAGFARGATAFPVEYPTACSPQAWASGAPLLMLRVLLGLDPIEGHLLVDPAIPAELERLELLNIPGRWGRADAFGRGKAAPVTH